MGSERSLGAAFIATLTRAATGEESLGVAIHGHPDPGTRAVAGGQTGHKPEARDTMRGAD